MRLADHILYQEDIRQICKMPFPWEKIKNKTIMITGASGMIGSFLIDVIMNRNLQYQDNCSIIAIIRNIEFAKERFARYLDYQQLKMIKFDINSPLPDDMFGKIDYMIHLASNTHPISYANDSIGTISSNIIGTYFLLQFSLKHQNSCFVFASSVEIYGENRGDTKQFQEDYCGYLNCNTLRAGYPESKRVGEALCQAFIHQEQSHIVIPRFSRIYGPSVLPGDSKAISQFITKAVKGEDIILKSQGSQLYSYSYVADSVAGLLTIMFFGKNGEAYNISGDGSDITLKNLANLIAGKAKTQVKMELPDQVEQLGYSKATTAVLSNHKLKELGWKSRYDIDTGLDRCIKIMKETLF